MYILSLFSRFMHWTDFLSLSTVIFENVTSNLRFHVFHRSSCATKESLLLNLAPFCSILYSTDFALTLWSQCYLTWLHSALFCIPQTLFSHYCTSELNCTELSLFIHSTDNSLTVNIYYWASKVHSALSMHSMDPDLILNSHFCTSKLNSAPLIHSTDLSLTLKSN